MIEIDYSGVDIPYNTVEVKNKISKIKDKPIPAFVLDKPQIDQWKKLANKYQRYNNIIVIGNGGSITSSFAFITALGGLDKKVHILSTMEPDYLTSLKKKCKKTETVVIPISKSGDTVGMLEATMQFLDYPMVIVTSAEGALNEIAKRRDIDVIKHPQVGGRYSGRTSCGLFPSMIAGLDVKGINRGALNMYKRCAFKVPIEKNPALKLSTILYALDKKGYTEIFMPIYSKKLEGFNFLVIQLIHESSCKEGQGQTMFSAAAPECQHHSNQRFFGGKKNILGVFIRVEKQHDEKTSTVIPKDLKDIQLRNGTLGDIDGTPLCKSLDFEFQGTKRDADNNRIPNVVINVDKVTPETIGEFLALWQYAAVYSSYLRDVNPFDQPQVENSKEISFELRRKYHP